MATLTTLHAASPLDADDGTRLQFTVDLAAEVLSRALDNVDTDFGTMDSGLTFAGQVRLVGTLGDDTIDLNIRILDSGGTTVLAGATSTVATAFQAAATNVTSATDVSFGPTAFTYVNTSANKSTWDSAVVDLQQIINKTKSPDGINLEVDIVTFDGTYTAAAGGGGLFMSGDASGNLNGLGGGGPFFKNPVG